MRLLINGLLRDYPLCGQNVDRDACVDQFAYSFQAFKRSLTTESIKCLDKKVAARRDLTRSDSCEKTPKC